MVRALIPSLFDDESIVIRPLFDEMRNWASACSKGACSDIGLFEDEESFVAEVPVPGLKAEEIKVDLKEGVLYVSGERKEDKREAKVHRRWNSKFSYSILLPQPVDEKGKIEAETKDGVLTVRLPKSGASKPVKIAVKSA